MARGSFGAVRLATARPMQPISAARFVAQIFAVTRFICKAGYKTHLYWKMEELEAVSLRLV